MILFVQEHIYFSFCHNGKMYQFFVSSWAQYRKASSRRKRIEEEKQSPKGADVCRTPLLLYMVASINCLGRQRRSLYQTLSVGLLLSGFVISSHLVWAFKRLWLLTLFIEFSNHWLHEQSSTNPIGSCCCVQSRTHYRVPSKTRRWYWNQGQGWVHTIVNGMLFLLEWCTVYFSH